SSPRPRSQAAMSMGPFPELRTRFDLFLNPIAGHAAGDPSPRVGLGKGLPPRPSGGAMCDAGGYTLTGEGMPTSGSSPIASPNTAAAVRAEPEEGPLRADSGHSEEANGYRWSRP